MDLFLNMKKKGLLIFSVFLFYQSGLFADQIILKDGSVINGKVLSITPSLIFYSIEINTSQFKFQIDKRRILKIIYSYGQGIYNGNNENCLQRACSCLSIFPESFIISAWGGVEF